MLCRRARRVPAMASTGLRSFPLTRLGTLFSNNVRITPRTGTVIFRGFSSHPERKLEGKIALITGAGSGIGKETAAKFIANGAKVVIADVNRELGQGAAEEFGPNAHFTPCDVSKEQDVSDAVDFTVLQHGRLDIMFNNAGIACNTPASVVDLDLNRFDQVMAINVRGTLAGIKHASRVMIPNKAGSILCTASVVGILGGMAQLTYTTSKSAVIGIVRAASAELCRHGVRINSISPFAIPTRLVMEEMNKVYSGIGDQRILEIIHGAGALEGASCEPVDIANAALYLASDDAKYVSGHNLVVDGGFTAFKSLGFPAPNQVN